MVIIRQILESEIPLLQHFPPEEWKLNLPKLFSFHFGHSYFYPVVAEVDGRIVGCGIGIIHGSISWLGTIIVLPEYRRQGIGQQITQDLIDACLNRGCITQVLTASEMGESVYRKLGFVTRSTDIFYKRESIAPHQEVSHVTELRPGDIPAVKRLDREATGEDRHQFLERFLSNGWIYATDESPEIEGFNLPDLGEGLIIARNHQAGLGLMKVRLNRGKKTAVMPGANTLARDFLLSEGFQEYRRAPRMILGKAMLWHPEMMYNRAAGYCG
jgi:GNAT superfamily N-acetyltransferase